MSVDIEKICRTCLALSGPLLSIYDGSSNGDGCLADMLRNFTKMKPKPTDNMPDKVCLTCISEINRCYSFKMKCENSNRTLRQLLPDAVPEEPDAPVIMTKGETISRENKFVQTLSAGEIKTKTAQVQTVAMAKSLSYIKQVQAIEESVETNFTQPNAVEKEHINASIAAASTSRVNTIRKQGKRRAVGAIRETPKTKYTKSYEIECDADGNEYILELQDASKSLRKKDITDIGEVTQFSETFVTNSNNDEYYEINEQLDCEEYEIQAVIEDEDPNAEMGNVVYLRKEDSAALDDCNKDAGEFVIIKNDAQLEIEQTLNIKREYECPKCVMTFFSPKVLRRHCQKRHGLKLDNVLDEDLKYRIPAGKTNDAEKTFEENTSNSQSESKVTNEEEVVLRTEEFVEQTESDENLKSKHKHYCFKCKSGFASLRAFNYHEKLKICNAKIYQCVQCQRVFTTAENLESHIATHTVECSECADIFLSQEDLSDHQIKMHNRKMRNQCHICKKVFTMLSTLRDHLRTHTGEKPFACPICNRSFAQNANLKQHMQRHDKDKKFKCDDCPNSYVTRAELFSHKRTHTGDQPFKCDICSKTFTTSCSLVKHKRKHTGERPYACDICPMRFAVLSVLKNHRRLHTGEKPFKCIYCDKRFIQKGDCMLHISKHEQTKQVYVCICGKSFGSQRQISQHTKRSTNGEQHREVQSVQISDGEELEENCKAKAVKAAKQEANDVNDDDIEISLAKICG